MCCVCLYVLGGVGVGVRRVHELALRMPEETIVSSGAEVLDSCQLSYVGAGN